MLIMIAALCYFYNMRLLRKKARRKKMKSRSRIDCVQSSKGVLSLLNGELAFTRLILHESGGSAEENEYELVKTEKGVRISNFFGNWWDSSEDVQSRKNCLAKRRGGGVHLYKELAERFGKLGVEAWDGFGERNPDLFDSDGFWLEIELEDGRTITASGSNAYPPNYYEFIDILRGLFENKE